MEIGALRAGGGGGRGERGMRRLPLICHKDGKHVMIANAEQIGLEKQAEEKAGERRQMA